MKAWVEMDVNLKIGGFTPKFDGLFHGKPYYKMYDLGAHPYFWKHPNGEFLVVVVVAVCFQPEFEIHGETNGTMRPRNFSGVVMLRLPFWKISRWKNKPSGDS